ncbi:MAG: hypothetical protein O7C62_08555 [Rickettsia endosymbiont of Ixodes persulcatus]|nr:hypothetical protein [Rickettsia endosymbiont of Ixodes persulcatus]
MMFDQLNILYPFLISMVIFLIGIIISKISKYEKTLKVLELRIMLILF